MWTIVRDIFDCSSAGDDNISDEEWDNAREFGIDVDAIQEKIEEELNSLMNSMKEMLDSMKSLFGDISDEE